MKQDNFEYLLSRHLLKKILAEKIISYAEYDEIDEQNKRRFLKPTKRISTVNKVING